MGLEEDAAAQGPGELERAANREAESASDEYAIAADQDCVEQDIEAITFLADAAPLQRPRRQKSILQGLIEIATGGLAGTLVAYYALAWYQGPAFDLPRFGLPWIEKLTAGPAKPAAAEEKKSEQKSEKTDGEEEEEEAEVPRRVPYPWPPAPMETKVSGDETAPTDGEEPTDSPEEAADQEEEAMPARPSPVSGSAAKPNAASTAKPDAKSGK